MLLKLISQTKKWKTFLRFCPFDSQRKEHLSEKLLLAFTELIKLGHTIVVIEHNLDVIKCADWLIDLGPEGGKYRGQIMYQGVPEGILEIKESHTSRYLANKMAIIKN